MLLPDNSNPKNCIYYIGGLILTCLKNKQSYDYLDLYTQIRENQDVSIHLYTLTLDWLYLISAAKFDDKEGVIKCI